MGEVPVPPFADGASARRFWRLLSLFLHQAKRPGEPVSFHHFLLSMTIDEHAPDRAGARCSSCAQQYPCRTLLRVALFAGFPVDWTPHGLSALLVEVGLLGRSASFTPTSWDWYDSDYSEHVSRDAETGAWSRRRHGKGENYDNVLPVGDDAAMCRYIAGYTFGNHPFPFGWVVDPEEITDARGGTPAALRHWAEHSQYPYIASHIDCGTGESAD